MRRPITLVLLLVAAGTLSAVAVTTTQQTDPDVYFAAKTEQAETGLKARLSAGAIRKVMLDFPEVARIVPASTNGAMPSHTEGGNT